MCFIRAEVSAHLEACIKVFPLLATIITLLILPVLHPKICGLDFSKGC